MYTCVTGKDVTCFAFGASGSGKTYTLWGTEEGKEGMDGTTGHTIHIYI